MQNTTVRSELLNSYLIKSGIEPKTEALMSHASSPAQSFEPEKQTLQSDVFENKEADKKKTIAKAALFTAVAISLTGGIIAAYRHKGGLIKTVKENLNKIKGLFKEGEKKAAGAIQTAKNATENMGDLQKGADNINNAKDSFLRHFLMKIPGYEKFDTWASNIYRNASKKTLAKEYSKAKNAFSLADDSIIEQAKKRRFG